MLLVFARTAGLDEARARVPAGSGRRGSAWGRSLLAAAWALYAGGPMPEVAPDRLGRPGFPAVPWIHFSLSHTQGLVLCAMGEAPVGADAERPRPLRPGLAARLMSPAEAADFDFFQLWTLRESHFKLTGLGGPRSPCLRREDGEIRCPAPELRFRLYDLDNCPAAVCTTAPPPVRPLELPPTQLLR